MFKTTLTKDPIQLEVFKIAHIPGLTKAAENESIWTYVKPPNQPLKAFIQTYLETLTKGHDKNDPFAYTIINSQTQEVLGSSRFYEISQLDKRLCIGFTWCSPEYWGTGLNERIKLAMLEHAFEDLGMNRVGFHVDSRNIRSLKAMAKIGAQKEGIMRKHKIVQGSFCRDTVLLAIIKQDWFEIKINLERVTHDNS